MSLQSIRDYGGARIRMPRVGWWNLLLALLYGLGETTYFGWNFIPKSGAEMACDGIALLMIIYTSNCLAGDTCEKP